MSARHPGIRARLVFSFLIIISAPLAVSLIALGISLSAYVPRVEAGYAADVAQSLQEKILPARMEGLRLGEIQGALASGDGDAVTALVKAAWPLLVKTSDTAEIVRADGTILFTLNGKGLASPGLPRPPVPVLEGKADTAPSLRGRFAVVPGFAFLDAGTAQYTWPLAPDKEGVVYGRYTFEIPGNVRAVESVSGQYTAIAVLAGIVTFAILVLILSLRLSRSILVPLRRFANAAENIASGNLDVPVSWTRADEFGRLAAVFEDMRVRLRESLVRLQRNDADRKHMVATVTHDLKTPLTSIRGYVEGLRDGVADNPNARDRYFSVILEKTAQLERLIDGLFRLSRLELEDAAMSPAPVSARALFTDLFARARRDVEAAAGITLRLEEPVPDVTVAVDAEAIGQVVDNIIQNARRHAPAQGLIRARVTAQEGMLSVSIADNGPGIASEDLPRVFDLFYRGDPARSSHQGEAGLGLAICKRLVERHGGTIKAENDGGAVITFTLPVAPAKGP